MSASSASAQIIYETSALSCSARGCAETRGLWVMNDNGSDAHLWLSEDQVSLAGSELSAPYVSPDGRTVVFSGSSADGAIFSTGIYKWQGGTVTRLSPAPSAGGTGTLSVQTLEARDPEVGPDGQVYYARRWHVLGSKYTGDHGAIWRQSLSDVGGQGADTGVCKAQLDIGFGVPDDVNIGAPSANPQWAGMFTYGGCYQVVAPFRDATLLQVFDPQSGEFTAIKDSDGWQFRDPSWSPDGSQIVFVRDHGTETGNELRIASFDGSGWSQRLIYSAVNEVSSPRFAGGRIIFNESNRFPDGNPCSDCGIGIRSIPVTCQACTEPNSTILGQAHNADLLDPAYTSATLPRTALKTTLKDGVGVLRGQTLRGALSKGLKLAVICNTACIAGASATIDRSLALKTGLLSRRSKAKSVQVAKGGLRSGSGTRVLTLRFTGRSPHALRNLGAIKLTLVVRCLSGSRVRTYSGTVTLRR